MEAIYLDNAATTRVLPEVADEMMKVACSHFGNPSSLHQAGASARRKVEENRALLAEMLGAGERDLTFTSGGTEANNLVVRGLPALNAGDHVLLSSVEHPSIHAQRSWLEERGVVVEQIPVSSDAVIDLDYVEHHLRDNTRFVAVMAVNNELGSIQPIEALVHKVRERAPRAHVHCDAVQMFGKKPVNARAWAVDSLSISAHKIHGPKGIGALYLRKGVHLNALVTGGSQERKLRPGTENVPGIAGFGAAARLFNRERAAFLDRSLSMRSAFLKRLPEIVPGASPMIDPSGSVPYILSIHIPGCSSETLLHFLEREGVLVSSGSACHGSAEPTHVIKALGFNRDPGSFRASLALDTPEDALEHLLAALSRVVEPVRSLSKKRARA
jgi:cysteine desulfurase